MPRRLLAGGGCGLIRILVADDSEVVRRGLEDLLRQHAGWEVCGEAVDGREAVQKVEQLVPDVVVLDFSMPGMNGIEAARQILQVRPSTRIVLCSMYLDRQLASLAETAGIRSLLSKSNVSRIIKGVEAALRGETFDESQI
ncbi:MAG: response regulator transcription factor [Acidobacteria bacterium]|nr:response regulator transcription factor [Acidobacteriota bacterium]